MTLGAAPEALAIGYLRNQRLVASIDDIVAVQVDWEVNAVPSRPVTALVDLDGRMAASAPVTTGCGQGTMFGDLMDEIDDVRLPPGRQLSQATLYDLLDSVRLHETIYKQAGAVHGCALATNGAESPGSSCSSRTSAATTRWTPLPAGCGSTASTAATRSSTPPAA